MSSQPPINFFLSVKPVVPQCSPNVFNCGDSFEATLKMTLAKGTSFSHKGIDFEFYTIFVPQTGKTVQLSQPIACRLSEPGSLPQSIEFQIPKCTFPQIQTYHGESFSVRHMIKIIAKKTFGTIEHQEELIAFKVTQCLTELQPLCVRVAIAENIRIDLMINRRKFELGDVIIGAAHFLLVALKIKVFTVTLLAQEVMEQGGKTKKHKNKIRMWEITDGAPIKGEIVPFRLYLAPLELTPSVADQTKGYSVTHFLHFTIVTTSGERYFKDLQIKLAKWSSLPFGFADE